MIFVQGKCTVQWAHVSHTGDAGVRIFVWRKPAGVRCPGVPSRQISRQKIAGVQEICIITSSSYCMAQNIS